MFMISVLLRLALFVVGSVVSFHLSAATVAVSESSSSAPVPQVTDSASLNAKEKELKEKQVELDAQAQAADEKLKETAQKAGFEVKEIKPEIKDPVVEKEVQEKKVAAKQEEIAATVKALDTKLDVPTVVAKVDHEEVVILKKELEKIAQRVAVLEAAGHEVGNKSHTGFLAVLVHASGIVGSFFNAWIIQPLQKLWMHHQSTVAK